VCAVDEFVMGCIVFLLQTFAQDRVSEAWSMVVRLSDVAEQAQVSVATVSKIVNRANGWDLYSEDCIKRVLAAAEELGYRPNYHARSLQTGRANALGLVTISPEGNSGWNEFWSPVVAGADAEALATGNQFVIIGPSGRESGIDRGLGFWQERRIDALIAPSFIQAIHPEICASTDAPLVVMGTSPEDSPVPCVGLDDAAGIREAVAHLASFGHRRLLWFGPDKPADAAASSRQSAFDASAAAHDCRGVSLSVARPATGWPNRAEDAVAWARAAFLEGWLSGQRGTAVVCFDERMAFGVYAAANELGLRIPDDLSVIGFDDIHASMAYPAMTVVSHMLQQIGRSAARLALEMVGDRRAWKRLRGRRERVPATLVIRQSTGPAPASNHIA
jgi:DNA-binding LacI/PurR family transcriptional regulator